MVSLTLAAIGAAIGAAAIGTAAVAAGVPHGLGVALTHIPATVHGYQVVQAVLSAHAARTDVLHALGQAVSAVARTR